MIKFFRILLFNLSISLYSFEVSLDSKKDLFEKLIERQPLFTILVKKYKVKKVRCKQVDEYELTEFLLSDENTITIKLLDSKINDIYYFINLESVEKYFLK